MKATTVPDDSRVRGGRRQGLLRALLAAWGVAVVGTTTAVWCYKSTPGPAGHAPDHWPAESRIARSTTRNSLLVFLHPKCPCSSATLDEVRRVAGAAEAPATTVVFVIPEGVDETWCDGALFGCAIGIPGVGVFEDRGGREAALFGARTSGHAVAYAPGGSLLFCGGLTTARGHVGASAAALGAILRDGEGARPIVAPVFGCSLEDR
ncbi:MAG: hypothetical protein JNK78_04415 [Planctomycetes bacterium]|nr:hypothetical protein [Planctomycetota bacterium]